MVVVPGHGNIPAGSDGYNLHSEAIANCQGQNFEACCSFSPCAGTGPFVFVVWHTSSGMATLVSSTSFRGAWVDEG